MRIALFGATGFVGSYIIESLIRNNHSPSILLREKSKEKLIFSEKAYIFNNYKLIKLVFAGQLRSVKFFSS